MLSLLFMAKKRKRTLEDSVLLIQEGENELRDEIIHSYKPFIAKTVSNVCKRYIYETDDEFSIGLIAFNEAIDKYSIERGSSLLSFAEVIITRRVIDYIRQQARFQNSGFDNPMILPDENGTESPGENKVSIEAFNNKSEQEQRREEIFHFQHLLAEYGLSLKELVENSPKHEDARKNAIRTAKILVDDEELKMILLTKKRLPIKQLEQLVSTSRKTLERNRKYIIAIALVLSNEYVFMKDYLKGVLEE